MIVHRLGGCSPTPLAHYLKALGILRIIGEQADSDARGWWDEDVFLLATKLDRDKLVHFFLKDYSPMPPVSPWNKGSGFYGGDRVLEPIEASTAERFARLREGIHASRLLLDRISNADQRVRVIKAETKLTGLTGAQREALRKNELYKKRLGEAEKQFKTLKARLIPELQRVWRGAHRDWMNAALVLEDDETVRFPALLGTGGNDGRLDFSNNYFQRLNDIFDLQHPHGDARAQARKWFEESLFGDPARVLRGGVSVGQFAPGDAGGANSTNAPEGDSEFNPVDFLLMLEGALPLTAAASRRLDTHRSARASAPFTTGAQAGGYASASDVDETARGEQWMPLWGNPATSSDLKRLLAEGRSQIGTRGAREPLDIARSIARLGTARGVVAFQRFGYIERNGQSNLAVPLGRFYVAEKSLPQIACLEDLDSWLPRLRRESRSKGSPARLSIAERRLTDASFAVTQHPNEPSRWQEILLCLADVEFVQISGSGFKAGPIPLLRPEWVSAADDGSTEFRLAVAFALQRGGYGREHSDLESVRRHWLPLNGRRFATTGTGGQTRLALGPDQVMRGRSGIEDAIAVVIRRLVEASRVGERRLPLIAARKVSASAADIASFLNGNVDDNRVLRLARGLMAVDPWAWKRSSASPRHTEGNIMPDDSWIAIRLAILPWTLPDGRRIGTDPAIVRRLAAGDAAAAFGLARHRLQAAGIVTVVRAAIVASEISRRWAVALAFPISKTTAVSFVKVLDPHSLKGESFQ